MKFCLFKCFSEKVAEIYDNFNRLIAYYVLKKQYMRRGVCKSCGKCCESIYVRHSGGVIKTEEEFERLQSTHFFYGYLNIIDKNEQGLVFECTKLDKNTGRCTAYSSRAHICRKYPQEEMFNLGGELGEECGFYFEPIKKFEDVFKKIMESNNTTFAFTQTED